MTRASDDEGTKVRPFLTAPMVIDWLQWSEFPEHIAKPNMPQIALLLIGEYRDAIKTLKQERDEYRAAIRQSISRSDDYADSYCSKPIREVLAKWSGEKK